MMLLARLQGGEVPVADDMLVHHLLHHASLHLERKFPPRGGVHRGFDIGTAFAVPKPEGHGRAGSAKAWDPPPDSAPLIAATPVSAIRMRRPWHGPGRAHPPDGADGPAPGPVQKQRHGSIAFYPGQGPVRHRSIRAGKHRPRQGRVPGRSRRRSCGRRVRASACGFPSVPRLPKRPAKQFTRCLLQMRYHALRAFPSPR